MNRKQAHRIYKSAASIVTTRGWAKGQAGWNDDSGPVCLETALVRACQAEGLTPEEAAPAFGYLRRAAQIPRGVRLYTWNDKPERTQRDVMDLLLGCANATAPRISSEHPSRTWETSRDDVT